MSENDIVDSGIPLPRMATVQPLPDYVLKVKWAEGPRAGREDLVNVSPAIFSYKVYRPLRDESLFLMGAIAEDGDAVTWGSEDLMMSADTIQSLAQESWTPKEFVNFLNRNKLTQEAAAALLGRSRRQIATYVMTGPISRVTDWNRSDAIGSYRAMATTLAHNLPQYVLTRPPSGANKTVLRLLAQRHANALCHEPQ
jgi:hypothetical protein